VAALWGCAFVARSVKDRCGVLRTAVFFSGNALLPSAEPPRGLVLFENTPLGSLPTVGKIK
jgi:hypothetical protein